jgi:hypothetical protein
VGEIAIKPEPKRGAPASMPACCTAGTERLEHVLLASHSALVNSFVLWSHTTLCLLLSWKVGPQSKFFCNFRISQTLRVLLEDPDDSIFDTL